MKLEIQLNLRLVVVYLALHHLLLVVALLGSFRVLVLIEFLLLALTLVLILVLILILVQILMVVLLHFLTLPVRLKAHQPVLLQPVLLQLVPLELVLLERTLLSLIQLFLLVPTRFLRAKVILLIVQVLRVALQLSLFVQ